MSAHDQGSGHGVTRRTVVRAAAAGSGGVLLGGALEIGGARPALAAPTVYSRSDWGARRPKQAARVLSKPPDHIVVHHTATANSSDFSKSHAAALSRAIQRHHMDTNGWDDIGQQLTISRGGHIMEGRNRSLAAIRSGDHVVGAHVANHNSHCIGIESEGTYTSATPPGRLMESLVETCAWLCLAYGLNPAKAIVGHRDYNSTGCPGDRLYALLPRLRGDVADRMRSLKARSAQMAGPEVPREHRPGYPDVPTNERSVPFYHGPAVGDRERSA